MKDLKREIAIILALCLVFTGIIPAYAAEQIPVSYYTWDAIKEILVEDTCTAYTEVTSQESYSLEAGVWYVVNGKVTITNRIENNATESNPAHLILTDGCNFHVPNGIHNENGKGLIICGQADNSGVLLIDEVINDNAGIGGNSNEAGGAITINGGTVNASGIVVLLC